MSLDEADAWGSPAGIDALLRGELTEVPRRRTPPDTKE
jgi:hypothetical protein